jgi:hypothetical protein
LLSLLTDGYATGCFSSRKIEWATDDSLAFRFIAANSHPDHDTLATFRRRFAKAFEATFVQVLQVARENQLSRFGTVSLDGTKIHANASRHRALSYGHAEAIEAQLRGEVQQLLALAEAADDTDCRSPAAASSSAATPKPWSIPRPCWSWCRRSPGRPTTNNSSPGCLSASAHCRKTCPSPRRN